MTPSTTQTQDHYPIPTDDDATKVDDDLARQQTQLVSSVRLGPGVKANPGPLGLFSFATTAFVLGLYECGVGLPNANALGTVGPFQAIFGLAVFVGGFAQFVAGCFEYASANTFGFTLHCLFGGFWLSFSMFMVPSLGIQAAYASDARAYSVAVGIYIMIWSLVTLIFLIGALRTNYVIIVTLATLAIAFFLLAVAQFLVTEHPIAATRVNRAGGAFACFTGVGAYWAGCYGLFEKSKTWVSVPVFGVGVHHSPRRDVENGGRVKNGGGEGFKLQAWRKASMRRK